jgi:hypothetical protein
MPEINKGLPEKESAGLDGRQRLDPLIRKLNPYMRMGATWYFNMSAAIGIDKTLRLLEENGFKGRVIHSGTLYRVDSPYMRSLQDYVERELGYVLPVDAAGKKYFEAVVIEAVKVKELTAPGQSRGETRSAQVTPTPLSGQILLPGTSQRLDYMLRPAVDGSGRFDILVRDPSDVSWYPTTETEYNAVMRHLSTMPEMSKYIAAQSQVKSPTIQPLSAGEEMTPEQRDAKLRLLAQQLRNSNENERGRLGTIDTETMAITGANAEDEPILQAVLETTVTGAGNIANNSHFSELWQDESMEILKGAGRVEVYVSANCPWTSARIVERDASGKITKNV